MLTRRLVSRRHVCSAFGLLRDLHWTTSRKVSTLNRSVKSKAGLQDDSQDLSPRLPETPCRTRFAPSPTGYLHLGSLRTALYNYLLAKATNGQFVLRLEDTDQSRLVADAEQRLYDDLKWAGLTWDEGPDVGGPYGPYKQSERLSLYDEQADRLIQEGKAYRCFCPPEDLTAHRLAHRDLHSPPPPNPCIHISHEESSHRAARGDPYSVVFKSAEEPTEVQDLVYGSFKSKLPEDDFILRKRDGFPTYHFANVVDDHAMRITHVIRGAEWLISTPKHVELYKALQWEPPAFAHVGLLVDSKKQKLSKRALGVDLSFYKNGNILPAALLNFAVLLGWSPGTVQDEVLTLEDMVQKFRLKFTKGNVMVQVPGKLPFFDLAHKRQLLDKEPPNVPLVQAYVLKPLEKALDNFVSEQKSSYNQASGTSDEAGPQMHPRAAAAYVTETKQIVKPDFFLDLLRLQSKAEKDINDVPLFRRHLIWQVPEPYLVRQLRQNRVKDPVLATAAATEVASGASSPISRRYTMISQSLDCLLRELESVPPESWTRENLPLDVKKGTELSALLGAESEPNGPGAVDSSALKVFPSVVRWALVASDVSPPNKEVMEFLGRDESLKRIKTAAEVAQRLAEQPDWQPEGFEWTDVPRKSDRRKNGRREESN